MPGGRPASARTTCICCRTKVSGHKPSQAQCDFLKIDRAELTSDMVLCKRCKELPKMPKTTSKRRGASAKKVDTVLEAPTEEEAAAAGEEEAPAEPEAPACCPRPGCANTTLLRLTASWARPSRLATIGLAPGTAHLCAPCKADATCRYRSMTDRLPRHRRGLQSSAGFATAVSIASSTSWRRPSRRCNEIWIKRWPAGRTPRRSWGSLQLLSAWLTPARQVPSGREPWNDGE